MTSQGSPLSVLRRAIRGGSLGGVDLALIDVSAVDLQDALEIVLLMREAGDPRFDRWAQRWLERATNEDAVRLAALLERIPDEAAVGALRERARELRIEHVGARVHLTERREAAGPPPPS